MGQYLVDTHAFYWMEYDPSKLSATAFSLLDNPASDLYVSAVSLWEIAIKVNAKKINLGTDFPAFTKKQLSINKFKVLPIMSADPLRYSTIEFKRAHKDPFDRMIIAQAIEKKIKVISKDRHFKDYPIEVYW